MAIKYWKYPSTQRKVSVEDSLTYSPQTSHTNMSTEKRHVYVVLVPILERPILK